MIEGIAHVCDLHLAGTGVLFGIAPALRATGLRMMPTVRVPTSRSDSRLGLVPERLEAVRAE